jgi:hypothetical protein
LAQSGLSVLVIGAIGALGKIRSFHAHNVPPPLHRPISASTTRELAQVLTEAADLLDKHDGTSPPFM